jgi:hypothetical protein
MMIGQTLLKFNIEVLTMNKGHADGKGKSIYKILRIYKELP